MENNTYIVKIDGTSNESQWTGNHLKHIDAVIDKYGDESQYPAGSNRDTDIDYNDNHILVVPQPKSSTAIPLEVEDDNDTAFPTPHRSLATFPPHDAPCLHHGLDTPHPHQRQDTPPHRRSATLPPPPLQDKHVPPPPTRILQQCLHLRDLGDQAGPPGLHTDSWNA